MRVLLDANILISYLLGPKKSGPIEDIVRSAFGGDFVLLLPEALLDEFVSKIGSKTYLSDRVRSEEMKELVEALLELGEVIPVIESEIPAVTRDPKDDYLLAYAVVGGADYLVTGDEDLLVLGEVEGVAMIRPREFVGVLGVYL